MGRRLAALLLLLESLVYAQRRVDPKNAYNRVIAVVGFVGSGTPSDPRRPQYAPWPPSQDPSGIIAFSYLPSDDGKSALVEFVARSQAALQQILNDKTITVFAKGQATKSQIESALQQYRKNLDTFGTSCPGEVWRQPRVPMRIT